MSWVFEEQKPVKRRSIRCRKHFVVAKKKTADILRRNTIVIPLARPLIEQDPFIQRIMTTDQHSKVPKAWKFKPKISLQSIKNGYFSLITVDSYINP